MLLHLHLKYMQDFSNGKQNVSWLEGKAVEHRGKFDTHQKDQDTEVAQSMLWRNKSLLRLPKIRI
jgi:hypothetical protein